MTGSKADIVEVMARGARQSRRRFPLWARFAFWIAALFVGTLLLAIIAEISGWPDGADWMKSVYYVGVGVLWARYIIWADRIER